MEAMEDKLTPREACVFALMSMGEGATVGDIMKVVDGYVLSLGVESPAPDEKDENGLLPCPFCGGCAKMAEGELGYKVRCDMDECPQNYSYETPQEARYSFNTRANTPSAGKDRTNEAIKVCADFAEAVVSGLKEKHQEEVSKLIGALEEVVRLLDDAGMGCNDARYAGFLAGKEAISAYKGKEAKEGGEG